MLLKDFVIFVCPSTGVEAKQPLYNCRTHTEQYMHAHTSTLLKKILESRLFVRRSKLGDCHLQENTLGIFQEETAKDFKEVVQ